MNKLDKLNGKEVKISAARYYELLKSENELDALDNFGVDNWCGYGEHRELMIDDDDLLDDVYANIIQTRGNHIE